MMSSSLPQLRVFRPWTGKYLHKYWWRHAHVAEENAITTLRSENLIRRLGFFVSAVHVRFDRFEALLGMRPGPPPSDLLESPVDYFIMENMPISYVNEQFFRAVRCRLDPTVAGHMPNAHQVRRSYWDELWHFANPRRWQPRPALS
jgi:hypothetical protein